MLMMIVRRKRIALVRCNLVAAMNAAIYGRVRRDKTWLAFGAEIGVIDCWK
jgi:hypothetical protein